MAKDIQESLIDSINTIVQNAIDKTPKDLTVSAVVTQCLDAEDNKYTIRYGINTATAYSTTSYSIGDKVLVHVPENDWSNTLTIIGFDKNDDASDAVDLNLNVDNDTKGYHVLGGSLFDMGTEIKHLSENCYDIIYRVNEYSQTQILSADDGDEDTEITVLESEIQPGEDNSDSCNLTQAQYERGLADSIAEYTEGADESEDEDVPEGDTSAPLDGDEDYGMPDDSDVQIDVGGIQTVTEEVQVFESNAINENYINRQEQDVCESATNLYLQADFRIRKDNVDGSFGIVFIFDFKKNSEIYQIPYYFDSADFKSNPLSFTELTTQGIIVDFEGSNFVRLNKVMIYSQDFSSPDIQVGNIKIYPLKKVEENSGYMVNISAKDGSYVSNTKSAHYTAKAYYNGADITQNVDFYWGVESDIQEAGKYHILLGKGYDYMGKGQSCDFFISDVESRKANVACVASYRNKIIGRENINVYNDTYSDLITLTPSLADDGRVILSCLINGASYYNSNSELDVDDDSDAREDAYSEKETMTLAIELKNFIFKNEVDEIVAEQDDAEIYNDYTTFLMVSGGTIQGVSNDDSETRSENFNKYTFRPICGRSDWRDDYMNKSSLHYRPYAFTFDNRKQTKTGAFKDIWDLVSKAVDNKIYSQLKSFNVTLPSMSVTIDGKTGTVQCDGGNKIAIKKSSFAKKGDGETKLSDARNEMRSHFIPLHIQVLNEQTISAAQNKLPTITVDDVDGSEDSGGESDPDYDYSDDVAEESMQNGMPIAVFDDQYGVSLQASSSTDNKVTVVYENEDTGEDETIDVEKYGYICIDPLTNDRYFINKLPSSGTKYTNVTNITDGTCLVDEDHPAVIETANPFVDQNGDGYLIIENDADDSKSQFYYPEENGLLNIEFVPALNVDETPTGNYEAQWVRENPDDDTDQLEFSITFYYNVKVDVEKTIKNNGIPVIVKDSNGDYIAAEPDRGEPYVKTQTFTSASDIVFDMLNEVSVSSQTATEYTYDWYRGSSVTNMHKFMSSTDTTNNPKSLSSILKGGTAKYNDNSIIIDEIGKNEVIGCKVYSSSDGYLGSSYITL